MTKEERIQKAMAFFKEGYNCSQSVVAAYADLYGFTQEQALHMSASFGGGIGRMRETCGAACGMFCWLVWSVAHSKERTVKVRLPIMRWFRNWRKSSVRKQEPCVVPTCWDWQRMSRLFPLPKHVQPSIMPSVRVSEW